MFEWWNSLDSMMKVLWAVTLSASLIFVVQTVLTFLGADSDHNFDSDASLDLDTSGDAPGTEAVDHSSSMGLLTFRNLINFLLGFGWTAVLLHDKVSSTGLLMLLAAVVGVILVVLVMMMFKWLASMQQSGNINVARSAVGCEGTVYLPIPAGRAGTGKVQISINDAVREYDALTEGDALSVGTRIKVVEVIGSDTLLVEEQNAIII